MFLRFPVLTLILIAQGSSAFVIPSTNSVASLSSTALHAKNRKARRAQRQDRTRPKYYDAIEEAGSNTNAPDGGFGSSTATEDMQEPQIPAQDIDDLEIENPEEGLGSADLMPDGPEDLERKERLRLAQIEREENMRRKAEIKAKAQAQMDKRPEVSTTIVDEENGQEYLAQGKNVLDIVTRKAVKLSDLGPEYRLAQMFPGVPPEIREKYRFDWKTVEVPEMIESLRDACSVKLEDGKRGIPPHPSVANNGIDFVLANRDYLGRQMSDVLGSLTMRNMWLGNVEEGREYEKLWRNFMTLENYISGPFRQIMFEAEGRVGPNFGNLEMISYCNGELYERIANYLTLKGMVAHWEKKVVDANTLENTPPTENNFISLTATGDPRRFSRKSQVIYALSDCTRVCYMAQQMCLAFVNTPELVADFPPEVVFLEEAFKIRGGTALRQYMINEFCPARGITPEGLREGVKRLFQQLDNMQLDPYAEITGKVNDLANAIAVGTDAARDPYTPYEALDDENCPAYFQSYTFDNFKGSLARFFDSELPGEKGLEEFLGSTAGDGENPLTAFLGIGKEDTFKPRKREEDTSYMKVPPAKIRADGRPHELGWLKLMGDPDGKKYRLGEVPPGKIIME